MRTAADSGESNDIECRTELIKIARPIVTKSRGFGRLVMCFISTDVSTRRDADLHVCANVARHRACRDRLTNAATDDWR